jgi:hypothetical protein
MADYYPLISRAVAALEKNSGENRRAIYERARQALLAQLRGVTPALEESDITRERLALEESIRKVEAESARQFVEASRQMSAAKLRQSRQRDEPSKVGAPEARAAEPRRWDEPSKVGAPEARAAEPRRWDEVERPGSAPRRYLSPPPQAPQESAPAAPQEPTRRAWSPAASPRAMPDAQHSDSIFDRPLPPAPSARDAGSGGEHRSPFDVAPKDVRGGVTAEEVGGAVAWAEESEREGDAPAPAPEPGRGWRFLDRLKFGRSEARVPEPQAPGERMFDPQVGQERMFEPRGRQERMFESSPHEPPTHEPSPQEPPAHEPSPHEPSPHEFSQPMLESSYAVDDAEPPAHDVHARTDAIDDEYVYDEPEEDVAPRRTYRGLIRGLIAAAAVVLIVGIGVWQWPNMVGLYRSFRAPAVDTAHDAPPPAATRPKITDRIEPSSPQSPAAPAPATQAAVPAAQKVVLYEEDPADPNGKRFVGSAIWRTETVTPGPGQPPELAIRADVEVPERKLAMTWSLRRNTDKGLPATHTVEIMFKLPADFPSGGISNVPGILMKQAEQTRGTPLAGLAVKVTPGFYLIGLSNAETDKDRNLQLLKERAWFDIPVVYNNNRRAILALEKGTPGERVFADAFKAWKQ